MTSTLRVLLLTLVTITLIALPATAPLARADEARATSGESDGLEMLDWAFTIASAIKPDPKDMAKTQQTVIKSYLDAGFIDRAAEQALKMRGWRQGAVLADVATAYAVAGRQDEAKQLLNRAKSVRQGAEGWRRPRLDAHIAQGKAAVGEYEEATETAASTAAADRMYMGRAAATVAQSHAARGEFKTAMEILGGVPDDEKDINVRWWQTVGYTAVAKLGNLSYDQRVTAIDRAAESAALVPTWKRAPAYRSIAEEYINLQKRGRARDMLKKAEEVVVMQPDTMPVKPALLANLSRSWHAYGDDDRAQALIKQALEITPNVEKIERPVLYGNVASGYLALGNEAEANRVLGIALDEAEALTNARPRAIAVAAICRVLGREGFNVDADLRARLQRILEGLKAPW